MSDRQRFVLMVGVMISVAAISMSIIIASLYYYNFEQMEGQLEASVQRHVRLIETIIEHNISLAEMIRDEDPDYDPYQAALTEFSYIHAKISDLGQTLEYTLAQQRGDSIVFLQTRRGGESLLLPPIKIDSDLAEPQSLALKGESGTLVGYDYRGQEVLAAYGYVNAVEVGIVVKIDLAEIRAPFIRATLTGILATSIIIILGSLVFIWVGNPVLQHLRDHNAILQTEIGERETIENSLKRTLETLDETQRISKLGSWYLDLSTNEVEWTEELYRMYGFDSSIPPPPYTEHKKLFTEASWENLSTALSKTAEEGIPYDLELETVRGDGTNGWMWVHGESLKNSDGDIFALRGAAQDITERKQAEEKVREKDIQFRKLSANVPDLIYQFTRRPDGSYYVPVASPGIKNIFGCSPEDVLDDFSPISKVIYPEDVERVINDIEYSAKHLTFFTCEFRVQIPGKPIQWILSRSSPEKLSDGSITWYGFNADVTEQKLAEEQISKSTALLKSIYDAIPEAIVATDINRAIVSVNKGFHNTFGFSDAEILGKQTAYFYESEEEYLRLGKQRYNLVAEEQSAPYVVNYRKSNGEVFPGETLGIPILNSKGERIGYLGVIRNISDKMKLEAQLRQSQKLEAVGTMVGGIAHEFNNVLQGIFLYGNILEGQLTDDKSRQSLKAMMDGSGRAKRIVSQIMAFSRQSEENIEIHDLRLILREAIDLERAMISSQIEVIEEITDDCGQIRCDSTQMQQIIINLFNNAQHAMQSGGKITVSLKEILSAELSLNGDEEKEHPCLELNISDTGTGMDKETLEKIFDPFFTTKEVGEGTGLGLSVVHGLVEQMGGTITAISKLGEGSTFRILLPVIDEVAALSINKTQS